MPLGRSRGEQVRLEFRGESGPILVRDVEDSELLQVVMPMRFDA